MEHVTCLFTCFGFLIGLVAILVYQIDFTSSKIGEIIKWLVLAVMGLSFLNICILVGWSRAPFPGQISVGAFLGDHHLIIDIIRVIPAPTIIGSYLVLMVAMGMAGFSKKEHSTIKESVVAGYKKDDVVGVLESILVEIKELSKRK